MNRLAFRRFVRREVARSQAMGSPLPPAVQTGNKQRNDSRDTKLGDQSEIAEKASQVVQPTSRYREMALSRLAMKRVVQSVIDRSRLPIAIGREGCAKCGVRGDLGCEHQRAMGEE